VRCDLACDLDSVLNCGKPCCDTDDRAEPRDADLAVRGDNDDLADCGAAFCLAEPIGAEHDCRGTCIGSLGLVEEDAAVDNCTDDAGVKDSRLLANGLPENSVLLDIVRDKRSFCTFDADGGGAATCFGACISCGWRAELGSSRPDIAHRFQ